MMEKGRGQKNGQKGMMALGEYLYKCALIQGSLVENSTNSAHRAAVVEFTVCIF